MERDKALILPSCCQPLPTFSPPPTLPSGLPSPRPLCCHQLTAPHSDIQGSYHGEAILDPTTTETILLAYIRDSASQLVPRLDRPALPWVNPCLSRQPALIPCTYSPILLPSGIYFHIHESERQSRYFMIGFSAELDFRFSQHWSGSLRC